MLLSEVTFLPTDLITSTPVVDGEKSGAPYSGITSSLPPLLKPKAKYSSVYRIEAKNPQAIIQPGEFVHLMRPAEYKGCNAKVWPTLVG